MNSNGSRELTRVCNRLRLLREKRKLSYEQVGRKCGMTYSNWRERENGKMDIRLTTLFRMLKALGTTPEGFFKGMK
jgi:transcriptional regulator with XRE-family HTH domain